MAAKSLRQIARKSVTRKALLSTLELQLFNDDIRSAVITTTALLDVGLERLLKAHMRRLSSDDNNALFMAVGPLASFSAKIRLAYALNLIGPVTRRDLVD